VGGDVALSKRRSFQYLRWGSVVLLFAGFACTPGSYRKDHVEDVEELVFEPKPCGPEIAATFDTTASKDDLDAVIGARSDTEGYVAGPRIRIRGKVASRREHYLEGDGDEPFFISLITSNRVADGEIVTVEGRVVRSFASEEGRNRRHAQRLEKYGRPQCIEGVGYFYLLLDAKVVECDAGVSVPRTKTSDHPPETI
jgi:hypothetical protein